MKKPSRKELLYALDRAYTLLVEFSGLPSWQKADEEVLRIIEKVT